MVNADRVAGSALSAAPGRIAMSGSGGFVDAVISAPYVVEVPLAGVLIWRERPTWLATRVSP